MNPPEADKGFIPCRLRRYNDFVDTPLLCGGAVHFGILLHAHVGIEQKQGSTTKLLPCFFQLN
jgi:hypothetical protein